MSNKAAPKKPTRKPLKPKPKPAVKPVTLKLKKAEDIARLGAFLDALVAEYKVPAYVQNDPIQLPYRYLDDPRSCELVAFITAMFSYGRRDLIIETMSRLFQIMGPDPAAFIENFDAKRDAKLFKHFVYRFNKGPDVVFLLERMQWVLNTHGSLEALWLAGCYPDLRNGIAGFTNALLGEQPLPSYGIKFLFAHPDRGGACKRFNMFLRWMVRQDEPSSKVDLGLWKDALSPSQLLVPLDTHVLKMNRNLGITGRGEGSWVTAEAVTNFFCLFSAEDPVQYDYALFGFSLDKRSAEEFVRLGGE